MLRASNKEKKEMLFGDFVFHEGANVTIRLGTKWYNTKGYFLARPSDPDKKDVCQIEITGTEIYRFEDLPARVIDYEHDEKAKNYSGLLKGMKEAYGKGFNVLDYVTVIYFHVR